MEIRRDRRFMLVGVVFFILLVVANLHETPRRQMAAPAAAAPQPPLVYVDRQTGCEYLQTAAGLTPRMGADGRQRCAGGKAPGAAPGAAPLPPPASPRGRSAAP